VALSLPAQYLYRGVFPDVEAIEEEYVFFAESPKIVLTQPIAYGKRTPVLYGHFRVAIRSSPSLLTTDKSSKHLLKLEIKLTLHELKKLLDAEVLIGEDQLDMEVKTAFVADLMSDVLAFATAGSLLITGLTNPQVVRTADVLDIAAIIMGRGKLPSQETFQLAEELNIPILTTKYILFEIAGRLYAKGIRGCIEKVGSK